MGLGFTTKSSKNSNSEGWGMGFLLVFFPEDQNQNQNQNQNHHKTTTTNFNLSSPPSSSSSSFIKRTNSANLFHKAQSTISICLLLLFTTLLLFTLSTLPSSSSSYRLPRRHLSSSSAQHSLPSHSTMHHSSHALQGMGTLYRRGTRAMPDLVVAHAPESLTHHEVKLFLRLFLRSSFASKSDLLLIFSSKTSSFDRTIAQECDSFIKLLTRYADRKPGNESLSFDVTQFTKLSKKEKESGEPIWGRKTRSNSTTEVSEDESTRPSYGSVVGFDVDELDPENSLSGFLDHVPMGLRRWACYPMLLGRVRRNFKHVALVDPKEILILGDPMGRVRSQSPESVVLSVANAHSGRHGRKNLDRTGSTRVKPVHYPGIIAGGSRGVRRLSNAMLTDIVRASMQQQRKKRNSVTESGIFNQLVGNDFALKNVNLIVSGESVPDSSLIFGSGSKSGSHLNLRNNHAVVRRGNLDVNSLVMKHLCSFPIDSTVYSDCL